MEKTLADCLHNNLLFFVLHGPPGPGKSRVIHALQKFAELLKLSSTVLITATTGAAAILLSAQTYHSALQLNTKRRSAKIVPLQLRARFLSRRILIDDEMPRLGTTGLSKID